MDEVRLDFDNLPLVEAKVRASFIKPIKLSFDLIYSFHQRVREEFPVIAAPTQFEAAPGVGQQAFKIDPSVLIGADFSGGVHGVCLSLQSLVTCAGWQIKLNVGAPAYPGFPELLRAFDKSLTSLRACDVDTDVRAVNISYTNIIESEGVTDVLQHYFSERVQVAAMRGAKEMHKMELAWCAEDGVDLRFRLEKVERHVEDRVISALRLTTIAGVLLEPTEQGPSHMLQTVHSRILQFFLSLLSENAKREWGLKEPVDG